MPKQIGIAMAVLGFALMALSVVAWNIPDVSKWFPVLLVAGGGFAWFGIKKYRWAY